ncbi:MAG: hypothetical protein P4N60_22330 [Verrucomicrobiae bacterium]|nr:hypothetical protein [Verrucomicrobiae bacterium]
MSSLRFATAVHDAGGRAMIMGMLRAAGLAGWLRPGMGAFWKQKSRPGWDGLMNFRRLLGFLGGFLGFNDRLFALDIGFATFLVFGFIVLLSHKCFYIICWLRFCV